MFFQDVSAPIYPGPPPRILEQNHDAERNIVTYEQSKLHSLPQILPNHYTGEEGYGNYGYVEANGRWVDPDCQNEVLAALHGDLKASYVPHLPIGTTPVSSEPEDEMYAEFMDEVANGLDGDGDWDPRATYITPATFARWAAGASQGDIFVAGMGDIEVSYALFNEPEPDPLLYGVYKLDRNTSANAILSSHIPLSYRSSVNCVAANVCQSRNSEVICKSILEMVLLFLVNTRLRAALLSV